MLILTSTHYYKSLFLQVIHLLRLLLWRVSHCQQGKRIQTSYPAVDQKFLQNHSWGVTSHELRFCHLSQQEHKTRLCLVRCVRIKVFRFMYTQTLWCVVQHSNNKDMFGLKYKIDCTGFLCFHLMCCLHIASMCFSTRKSKPAFYVLVCSLKVSAIFQYVKIPLTLYKFNPLGI